MVDKDVIQSKEFGYEFGTYSDKVNKTTNVKSITVSPITNLKLMHSMIENKSNLAITVLPLSIIQSGFPLSEHDFELLRSLTNNNIRTVSISTAWLYSQNGAFGYFLQTLGINKFTSDKVSLSSGKNVYKWNTNGVLFKDFLANLSHLTHRWTAFEYASEDKPLSFTIDKSLDSNNDLDSLKKEGITTVLGFNLDSNILLDYQKSKMNYIFVPIYDFCNIALRKFAQLLQMKVEQKVTFFPFEIKNWLNGKK